MNKDLSKVIKKIEELDWNVSIDDGYAELNMFSPAGQDFNVTINMGDSLDCFINNILKYHDSFDVSYETYLWLDSDGHGKNGAPYDMKDIYEDMEYCKDSLYELYDALLHVNSSC